MADTIEIQANDVLAVLPKVFDAPATAIELGDWSYAFVLQGIGWNLYWLENLQDPGGVAAMNVHPLVSL